MTRTDNSLFSWNGRTGPARALPLALQHLIAMVVGCVSPSLLIATAAGLDQRQTLLLLQSGLLVSGIATLIQVFPLFGRFGARLPLVFGVSLAFVPVLAAIAAEQGMATAVGAQLVGSLFAILFGALLPRLKRLFPSVVAGTVVITVGISLYPIAISNMAGGAGSADFGSAQHWILSFITLGVTLYFSYFRKGILKYASLLCGILVGFVAALFMGMVDFSGLADVPVLDVPGALAPLPFGIRFELSSILAVSIMFLVNGVQIVGEISATTTVAMGREPTARELAGGIMGNGLCSFAGALLGSVPTSALGRNMGIVANNKVINRTVFALTAVLLVIAGLMPIFSALLTAIPRSVLGGATLSAFAAIVMTGVKLMLQGGVKWRSMVISGISIALCMGILNAPESIAAFPGWVRTVFGASPVTISAISAILLNILLPKKLNVPGRLPASGDSMSAR